MSPDEASYTGQCFCGTVAIEVRGAPEVAGYCHCKTCRSWSAAPVSAFTLWKAEAVRVTGGADEIGEYNENEDTYRQWCKVCGGHVLSRHPRLGIVDVPAATMPAFPFVAGVHVNYESSVLPMDDDLPKFKDLPAPLGGSGETVAG